MTKWSIIEWLIFQFAVLAAFGTLGFGIAFQVSKSRIRRLQAEFKKLASEMGEALASAADEQGVHLDALLMQTQAYLQSQGLLVPWQQVDPLQYPELLPLFLRCAVLDVENKASGAVGADEYWSQVSAAYEQILFKLSRDTQASNVNIKKMQCRIDEAEELAGTLRGRIATLETDLLRTKENLRQNDIDNGSDEGLINSSEHESVQNSQAFETKNEENSAVVGADTAEQHVAMLSNIIEDQKVRIQSMQEDLNLLQKNNQSRDQTERGLEAKKKEKNMAQLEEKNQVLKDKITSFELALDAKNLELTQLLDQIDTVSSIPNHVPADEVLVRRALVEAWLNTEQSLAAFEHQVLSQFKRE